ncbi:coproporphyrinogen III oxidase [Methanobrevibacter cuticularis]|uniref:Coproporphyrinogen III oxidase n=1 Tax=Methanobrevibacter cuticularis TaxID=47311 RepID=A0A166FLK6_9EURY|nr:radical SAM protein [Methanobrevibacter cuticularis]KZX17803.1 coproporphyrinogen III oxidase [Methanobrevibacter cuticularis]
MIYEENVIKKKPMKVNIRFASVYPNLYRTAMSSLGYQIIYGMINDREDCWCERVIYPNTRSIESNSPLKDFDIISFTLQYEQDYFNVLEILKKANIPIKKKDRECKNDNYPLIIAGGPCATSNPLPLTDFIDIFIIGEAEVILDKFLNKYQELNDPKKEIASFLDIKGIYISDNPCEKAIVSKMDKAYHVVKPIITKTDDPKEKKEFSPVFGNSILLNVSRGCTRGCRFCMSGYMYRPIRETSLKKLLNVAELARANTDENKVSLIGAAVSDYSKIDELTHELLERGFQISTPSLRIESITDETLTSLKLSGAKTITIAPESISKLRQSINKNITNEKIEEVIKNSIELGLNLKLYFLIGLPNETKEDIIELASYIKYLNSLKYNSQKTTNSKLIPHSNSIKFSVNPLIPKPHTPLQWEGYDINTMKSKIKYLRSNLKKIAIRFDSAKMGLLQYVLSCKGKEIGKLLEKSLDLHANKDINKRINLNDWKKHGNGYNLTDTLPWNNINIGISQDFLKTERQKLFENKLTPWCSEKYCYGCKSCRSK